VARRGVEIEVIDNVVVSHWTELVTVEEASTYCDRIDELLRARRPFSIVLDTRGMQQSPDARVRKVISDRLLAQRAARQAYLRGEASVIESVLVRGGLTAIYWLSSPGYPWKIFGNMPEAVKWARAQLSVSNTHP